METLSKLIPFSFEWAWALLLLPVPFFLKTKREISQSKLIAPKIPLFYTFKQMNVSTHSINNEYSKWQVSLLTLAWICLVLALTRPTYYGAAVELPLSGRDLMLSIDISPSMKEQDLTLNNQNVTRLKVVKDVVSEFISQRTGDRVGLILFGSEPYIQAPLTFDTKTVHTLLEEAYLLMIV